MHTTKARNVVHPESSAETPVNFGEGHPIIDLPRIFAEHEDLAQKRVEAVHIKLSKGFTIFLVTIGIVIAAGVGLGVGLGWV